MNILITGATGFIGSKLVEKLLTQNHKLIVLKRFPSNSDDIFKKNKIDVIIHLAAKYFKYEDDEDIKEMISTNVLFPSILLEKAKKYKIKYFINTGSCFEYGLSKKKIKETGFLEPFNFYAATKIAFEQILKYYCQKKYIKAVSLKLFFPYGENDHRSKLISSIIFSLLNKRVVNLTKGGQQLDFTYVDDIVEAYLKSLNLVASAKSPSYSFFNIGYGKAISVKKVVEILTKIHGDSNLIKLGKIPYNKREIMFMEADNKKARETLGWKPNYDIMKGLTRTYNYFK